MKKIGLYFAIHFITSFFFLKAQNTVTDSLENIVLAHTEEDRTKVKLLNDIASKIYSTDSEKSLKYAKEAGELANKIGYKEGKAESFKTIGIYYYWKGAYHESLDFLQKSLKLYEDLGIIYGIASCLNNIGLIQNKQGDFIKALESYERALEETKELEIKDESFSTLNNIGNIYNKQGDHNKALSYYEKSLKIAEELENRNGISRSYNNIGAVYYYQSDYLKALEYFQKSLMLKKEIDDKIGICLLNMNIGDAYLNLNNYNKALDYSYKSLMLSKEIGFLNNQKSTYLQLSKIYVDMNIYKKAHENYVLYKELEDSIFNEKNIKDIAALEYQFAYEKEKQATELERQKKDALNREENKRQKYIRNSLIVGTILLINVIFLILRVLIIRRKAIRALNQQKEEIQVQAKQIKDSNNRLLKLDEFKQDMINLIVHDLKNPLNRILNIPCSYGLEKQVKMARQSGKQMLNMVLNILDVNKYQDRQMKLILNDNPMYLLSVKAIEYVQFLCDQKDIKVKNEIEPETVVNVDKLIIERVLINLLTNAIKYTPKGGIIALTSEDLSESYVRINVTDNGSGILPENFSSVFQKFEQIIVKQSGSVSSTGLGLTFCKMATEEHGGEIGLISEPEKSTTFWFTLQKGNAKFTKHQCIEKESKNIDINFVFSEEDLKVLKPVVFGLKSLAVYETTDVRKNIDKLKSGASESVQQWICELEKNLITLDQKKYLKLLEIVT
ncbi:MAG: tetratricopeptide repeat protein [Bacteroidales bacterium]|nr:tetratricopeptide repeat protein [Bacteroidales bacterium]